MFIFDLDNFTDIYVRNRVFYLGLILYFNWLQKYLKTIIKIRRQFIDDFTKIYKTDHPILFIRAPPIII